MDISKLEEIIDSDRQPKFRLEQIKKSIFKDGILMFSEISTLPKDLRERLDRKMKILSFAPERVLKSLDGRSLKALLKLRDGEYVETVLISPKPETWSACISCQVGCPMGCLFCATGKGGFRRNLTGEEITDQVLFWRQYLKKNKMEGIFSTVVFMGMGEPFLNWREVKSSIRTLTDPGVFGFGSRSISVSTAGIPDGLEKMARDFPQVNLAISLHFASDKKRSEFMMINKSYDLGKLRDAIERYFRKTRRKIFLEYIMLEGINDSPADAEDLASFVRSTKDYHLLHVNLIRYNATDKHLLPSTGVVMQRFKNSLLSRGINVTIRKSLGEDIQGACGQLAGKNQPSFS